MADRLQVDLDGLTALAGTARDVRSRLNATRRVSHATRDVMGSSVVSDALESFEDHWDDGRGQIDKNLQAMGEILDESVTTYTDADTQLANKLHEQASGTAAPR